MARLTLALWTFFVLAITIAASQVTPVQPPPISITISAPSLEVRAGSEFKVSVAMINTSDERIGLSTRPEDFIVDICDSDGKAVGKAKEPNEFKANSETSKVQLPIQRHGSSQGFLLAPHAVYRWEENAGKKLDLSKPGKYTIQVTQMYGETAVKSNTITIAVVP